MPVVHVSRSIRIGNDPDVIREYVKNFRNWPEWSPWLIAEPECRLDFADDGKSYSWEGRYIGAGSIARIEDTGETELITTVHFAMNPNN